MHILPRFLALGLLSFQCVQAQVVLQEAKGWLESAHVTWKPMAEAESYHVYRLDGSGASTLLEDPLVRSYGTWMRADAVGLPAGTYRLKVVPVVKGVETAALAATSPSLTVRRHVREGYAFVDSGKAVSPGGYAADGSPKPGAKILYVTSKTANTATLGVLNDKGKEVVATGLMNILTARGKGYDKTPLIIRLVGQVTADQISGLVGGNYVAFAGANTTDRTIANITFEGIGDDATAYGYGFHLKRSQGIEIRNLGIMLFGDDGVSLEGDNHHVWIHNNDFFYGKPGSDADQVKGDGSVDMKYNSTNVTISFNHFWDSGKSTFAGGAVEANPIFFTYHHNWFDHSDSRHPRLCHATAHVYNNHYDGIAGMGLLNTENTSAFVEANSYRYCPYPMMINMQGTNYSIWPDGTQNGGMTKAYNNKMTGIKTLVYQTQNATEYDAYLVTKRSETIPASVKSKTGGNTYSNFDTDPGFYAYVPDSPDSVEAKVTADAGRVGGGDLQWTFTDAVDDTSHTLNAALKAALTSYRTQLVSIQGEAGGTVGIARTRAAGMHLQGRLLRVAGARDRGRLEILDLSGRALLSLSLTPEGADLSRLPSGAYLARATWGSRVALQPIALP